GPGASRWACSPPPMRSRTSRRVIGSGSTATSSSPWTSSRSPARSRKSGCTGCSSIILPSSRPLSPMRPLRVLFVEDSAADAELMVRALRAGGFDPVPERVETVPELLAALERGPWDVVLSDYYLPALEAPAALALVR